MRRCAPALAAFDVAAQGCRSAALNRRHDLQLAEAHMAGMGRTPRRSVVAEDVCHLDRRPRHRPRSAGHQQKVERTRHFAERADGDASVKRRRVELFMSEQNLDDPDIGLLFQEMRGKAVPQGMNADTFGNAGTPCCQANDPVELACTRMLPAVAGKQPGLTGRHPALLARNAPPFVQYLEQHGRENDVPILLAPRFREGRLLPCSTRMTIRLRSISVSLSDTTSEARRPVA